PLVTPVLTSKTSTPSPSPGFVKDPFHPGAPGGELAGVLSTGTDHALTGTAVTVSNQSPDPTGLVRIRIRPDSHGRFGFNVRGGADHGAPIIVSRVGANMPADLCIPRLSEGDQLCSINGRDVAGCTHAQVVSFIRAASEDRSGVLELLVRPSDYVLDEWNNDEQVLDSGDAPPLPPRASHSIARATSTSVGLTVSSLNGSIRRLNGIPDPTYANAYRNPDHGLTTGSGRNSMVVADIHPLLQSMLDLESGLADGSILTQFEVSNGAVSDVE
ncbi:unnamed protein product, partial [Echinostoma caproni]|uniref:PDZ domain-containing protein n=1 Tax=Echinostoma caproni TaxID=27848 RepID=A0A183B4E3_9TREM